MAQTLKHPQSLPAMYYRAIGEVAFQWNMLELYMQSIAWHCLGLTAKEGRVLTYKPGARDKINILKALVLRWVKDPATIAEIKDIARKAEALNNRRNEIVHGIWGHEIGKPKKLELLFIKKTEERLLPRAYHMTGTDVKRIATEIRDVNRRLIRLHSDVGAGLP